MKIITLSEKKKTSIKPYTTTRIKSRNFLSNISYIGINKEDFYNQNFVFDVYALITKNLNSFFTGKKTRWTKQGQNDLYALERMHTAWISQVCRFRRKFRAFEWKKHALFKSVRNNLKNLYKKMRKTATSSGITCAISKTFSNTFIRTCVLGCIAQLREGVLI